MNEFITYLKEANEDITPAIFHSYRAGGAMVSLHGRKPTATSSRTQHAQVVQAKSRRGHYITLENLSLFSHINPWLTLVCEKGINILSTRIIRNSDFIHRTIIETDEDPRQKLGFDHATLNINNSLVDVSYLNDFDEGVPITRLDRRQVLLNLKLLEQPK